jgi:hypothetical protein
MQSQGNHGQMIDNISLLEEEIINALDSSLLSHKINQLKYNDIVEENAKDFANFSEKDTSNNVSN